MTPKLRLIICSIACLGLSSCGGGGSSDSGPTAVPADTTEQWTLSAAADVGMDAGLLSRAVSTLPAGHGLSSLLIQRHGKPVVEQYWNGYDKDTLHDLRSATKSITSLLIGVAIDQHVIGSVNDPIANYLGAAYPGAPALQRGITLENLLTMRSGLACNDWDNSSPGNESRMYEQADWVQFYLNLPQSTTPGVVTQYCTGNPVTLGRVLGEASKKSIPALADTYLFNAMGIKTAQWASYNGGQQTDTGGHIKMRPRDMAKIGQLALQKGMWGGVQLVSSAWIAQSTGQHTAFPGGDSRNGYGYLWWRSVEGYDGKTASMFYANGNGGQYIFVVPTLDLVVVFTGENYNSNAQNQPFAVLDNYILPAIK